MSTDPADQEILKQIYETHSRTALLIDRLGDLRLDSDKRIEAIWMELRSIKHNIGNEQQIISGRLELADRRSGEIERRIGELEKKASEIERKTGEIADGMKPLVDLRQRIWGIGALLGGVLVFLWIFAKPVYDAYVSRLMGPPPGH